MEQTSPVPFLHMRESEGNLAVSFPTDFSFFMPKEKVIPNRDYRLGSLP